AVQSERQAREAAPVCPACRKQGVIPAHAPMAKHYFETVPALAHQAEIVTRQVLAEFPEMTIVEAEAEAE
ncbi:MAG: hypothetical protein KGI56_01180, partial [Acidobacteriota bacterium]|nr:hypothetical protein [Acidobacteriota bacterium]